MISQATPLDQLRNVAACPLGIFALTTRCIQTDPGQRPKFLSIVNELQRIKGSVRASRPSTHLRRADAIGQAGATAAPTFNSATYCASTDTSATCLMFDRDRDVTTCLRTASSSCDVGGLDLYTTDTRGDASRDRTCMRF